MSIIERLCPECGDKIHARAVACACGWRQVRQTRNKSATPEYDSTCRWNDHGHTCGAPGVCSPSTGGGDWYCRKHIAMLRGREESKPSPAPKSYRQRAYETMGKPYEAPAVGDYAPFRCVGRDMDKVAPKRRALPDLREPGEDTQEEVYGEMV